MDIEPWLPYLAMPFIVAFIGWITNVVGLRMMFYPVEWRGIAGVLGWQGIIPRIRERFTRDLVNDAVVNVCTPVEMLAALHDDEAIADISRLIRSQIEDAIDDFMQGNGSKMWVLAPSIVRKKVYKKISADLPEITRAVILEITENRQHLLDIESLAAERSKQRPGILGELILSMFGKEFRFMERSGLYIGFPLGCVQAVLWYFLPLDILLPVIGALVGGSTNWLALNILAYPAEPKKVAFAEIQGLAIKRQPEVSDDFAEKFTEKYLNTGDVIEFMWQGPHAEEIRRMVKSKLRDHMDAHVLSKGLDIGLRLRSNSKPYDDSAIEVVERNILPAIEQGEVGKALVKPVQELISSRMKAMSPHQFQGLFLPIFQQDKWLLISVGSMLGAVAGTMQLILLFGERI